MEKNSIEVIVRKGEEYHKFECNSIGVYGGVKIAFSTFDGDMVRIGTEILEATLPDIVRIKGI